MTELMGRDEEVLLSDRKKKILKAIIDAHIAYGEPVGSKYLAQDAGLNCSSATIRNEMAELEALGLLEQPHTSAGRVPSELGYRYYVTDAESPLSLRSCISYCERARTGIEKRLNEIGKIQRIFSFEKGEGVTALLLSNHVRAFRSAPNAEARNYFA